MRCFIISPLRTGVLACAVLVVGGGGVGMETVRALAKAGSWVTAYQRGEKFRQEIEGLGSMLALGDVLNVDTIENVLRSNSFDAIVCTVGKFQLAWLSISWMSNSCFFLHSILACRLYMLRNECIHL